VNHIDTAAFYFSGPRSDNWAAGFCQTPS
jgi:hypothetical protein